ncbi:hypothetical protein GCM10029978_090200 [Actinoallomurus acanthiterrae]
MVSGGSTALNTGAPRHGIGAAARGLAYGLAFCGLTLAGAAILLAAPALVLDVLLPGAPLSGGPSSGDRLHLWLGLVVTLVPCTALGVRWAAGRAGPTAGATLLVPPVLTIAAILTYGGPPPGGDHGAVWLAIPLVLCGVLGIRWVAWATRSLVGACCGVPIAAPYQPVPGARQIARWLLTDTATGRDLLWTAVNAGGGCVLVTAPPGLILYGLSAIAALDTPVQHTLRHTRPPVLPGPPLPPPPYTERLTDWLATPLNPGGLTAWLAIPLGLAMVALGLYLGPRLLPVYGRFARSMLGPNRHAELALRVRHLAQTRSDTLDSGAAEMRRIERDLHDGAQARLVAMGMTLDAAEGLVEASPAAARALLTEARDSSVKALEELRDLVRGIHPPVLADRGLVDALRALALDLPLRVEFSGELPDRPPAPVESAAYFAVSELLANVSKHAGATHVWIDVGYGGGTLRIGVTDDGRGGADPAQGTGLRGLERRLAAFDGVLAVSSPPGGPTMVNLEIPCA